MEVNGIWNETCKILLGQEIGDVNDYSGYLQKFIPAMKIKKSAISSTEIAVCEEYDTHAKFISGNEIDAYGKKMDGKNLDINQIKDIDSIVEAIRERAHYAGNIRLGKSEDAEFSNRLIDSTLVYKSSDVFYSMDIGYSHLVRYSEYIFGSMCNSKTRFGIRNFETFEHARLMETVRTYHSSDCYYTSNLEGCQNCMFSFNLRNRRNCIGNIPLAFDRYNSLKAKLIEDISDTLKTKKELPAVVEIVGGAL